MAGLRMAAHDIPEAAKDIGTTILGLGEGAGRAEAMAMGVSPDTQGAPRFDVTAGLPALEGLQTFATGGMMTPESAPAHLPPGSGTMAATIGRAIAADEFGGGKLTLGLKDLKTLIPPPLE
jgi:hypothetical protein